MLKEFDILIDKESGRIRRVIKIDDCDENTYVTVEGVGYSIDKLEIRYRLEEIQDRFLLVKTEPIESPPKQPAPTKSPMLGDGIPFKQGMTVYDEEGNAYDTSRKRKGLYLFELIEEWGCIRSLYFQEKWGGSEKLLSELYATPLHSLKKQAKLAYHRLARVEESIEEFEKFYDEIKEEVNERNKWLHQLRLQTIY